MHKVSISHGTASVFRIGAKEAMVATGKDKESATSAWSKIRYSLARWLAMSLARVCYRLRVFGAENVPQTGPALLVSNHVTWVDGLLISLAQRRRIRFLMGREIFETWWGRPIASLMRAIPVSPKDPPREMAASLKQARAALEAGDVVCVFAEGSITRNGNMREFKAGFEHILRGTAFPIIPVHVGGAWGSIFSYYSGRLMGSWPRNLRDPVTVTFGAPMAPTTRAFDVRTAVLELSAQAAERATQRHSGLGAMFIQTARRNWFRPAMADTTGRRLTYGRALVSAMALGAELRRMTARGERVGVLLPASVGGALTNIALTVEGRVAVNLNFTSSADAMEEGIRQCRIQVVVSSRRFLEKMEGIKVPQGTVLLEDLLPRITGVSLAWALLKAVFAPCALLSGIRNARATDLATVIFSSGSTGAPKGVLLSHRNIMSNIEGFRQVLRFDRGDGMCCVLPFFHSFGYTCTLWTPLTTGFGAFYHPNPLDGAQVACMVREERLTVLLATPTFLLNYARRAQREDFASLRIVMVGAEKLRKEVAELFEAKFGIRPHEGYGATELSPVVAVGILDVEAGGERQTGSKEGSVGHPIPGVAVKVVDPDTGRAVPEDGQGVLLVRGPNVMMGYLEKPEETAAVLKDGWYDTRDIARMDRDGFIYLTDRLSRFSKIGGEMVPHLAVEEAIRKALGAFDPGLIVTAAPDERKGEQLVVLYTDAAGSFEDLERIVERTAMPNLWRPKHDNYFHIDAIPSLGSGKTDIRKVKALAAEFVARRVGGIQTGGSHGR